MTNDHTDDMPDWLRDAWPRVSKMLAISLAHQRDEDRAEIMRSLNEGHPVDWMPDGDHVVFGVCGTAFCQLSMAAITGIPATKAH